jgi:hypothetical protein
VQVLHDIDAAILQMGKQAAKREDHMLVDVSAIIGDEAYPSDPPCYFREKPRVGLITRKDGDSLLP